MHTVSSNLITAQADVAQEATERSVARSRVEEPRLNQALGTSKTSFFLPGKGKMPSYPWEDGSVHFTILEKTSVHSFIPQIHCSRHRSQQKNDKIFTEDKVIKTQNCLKNMYF